MSWTSVDDIKGAWLGSSPLPPDSVVQSWIDKAERVIRGRVSTISERLATQDPDGELLGAVQDVVYNMLRRVFTNPDMQRSFSSSTGPFTDTVTASGDNPGALYLEPSEMDLLKGYTRTSSAFSVSMTPVVVVEHPLLGAWVNGPDGYAPGEYYD